MKRWVLIAALAGLTGCPQKPEPDAGVPYANCLDQPGEVARAPGSELPCELLPPGFKR